MVNMQSAQLTGLIHYVCRDLFNNNVNSSCLKQNIHVNMTLYCFSPQKTIKRYKNISPN